MPCIAPNPKKEFCCDRCDWSFDNRTKLKRHKRTHEERTAGQAPTEKRRYPCELCDWSFHQKYTLDNHKSRIHDSNEERSSIRDPPKEKRAFQCKECDWSFHTERDLKRHIFSHTKEPGDFKCKECERCFHHKWELRKHERIHAERERKFKCEQCEKGYYNKADLNRHLKTHDEDANPNVPPSIPRKFPCKECKWSFHNEPMLKKHIEIVHPIEYKFSCVECKEKCRTKMELKHHVKLHTENLAKVAAPLLLKEWHTDNERGPEFYLGASNVKVKWKCSKEGVCEHHEWETEIYLRHLDGNGCPYCGRKRTCPCENLTTEPNNKKILDEWHPTKNEKGPDQYLDGSNQKVWWKCSRDPAHEDWQATIIARTAGYGNCKICYSNKSYGEKTCQDVLTDIFGKAQVLPQQSMDGCKHKNLLVFDFIVPPNIIGPKPFVVEFDGLQHFRTTNYFGDSKLIRVRDMIKNRFLRNRGIHLLRISESCQKGIEGIIKRFIERIKTATPTETIHQYVGKQYDSEYMEESNGD